MSPLAGRTTPPEEGLDASGMRFVIVAARFHREITEALFEGAMRCLKEHGAEEVDWAWVPGAFELPLVCRELAVEAPAGEVVPAALRPAPGPQARLYDGIVALGCVIRGETPHFDFVAGEAARGIMTAQLETGVPIGFGVLTTDTREQALARAGGTEGNKGYDAALTVIETAAILRRIR